MKGPVAIINKTLVGAHQSEGWRPWRHTISSFIPKDAAGALHSRDRAGPGYVMIYWPRRLHRMDCAVKWDAAHATKPLASRRVTLGDQPRRPDKTPFRLIVQFRHYSATSYC